MATQSTRQYLRPRKGRAGFDLLHAGDTPDDEQRLALEGYRPADGDTARAAVTYNSKGWAQGEDAYRLGLKDRPVEVSVGMPTTLWRKEQPKDEDWGDGKRGGASGATGRELDEAGMLGTGPDVDVREGTPSLVSRTPEREQDWSDGKMSGASNPGARGGGLRVGASSKSPDDAGYLDRLKTGATLPGKSDLPFSDMELSAMFEGGQHASPSGDEQDPELAAAQVRGQDTRLAAAIGRAGAQFNESLTGAKFDRTAYDGYAAEGDRPVGELLQRREAVTQRQGRARTAQQDRMRAEEAARAYRRQRDNDAYGRQRDAMGDARQAARDAEDARRFNLSRQDAAANRAATRGAGADARLAAQQAREDAARAKADAKAQEDALKRGEKLGTATSKAPFGEMQTALESLEQQAPGLVYGQEPEKNPLSIRDRVARIVPFGAGEWAMSEEGQKYAATIQNLRDLISRARSGAALNAGEEAHYLRLLGDDVLSDPGRAAAGINQVRTGLAQKLRNAQAPFAGDVLDTYEREGGTTYRNPIFSEQQRAQAAAPVVMVSPDGRQYTVDPSEVDEAQQNGWRLK